MTMMFHEISEAPLAVAAMTFVLFILVWM